MFASFILHYQVVSAYQNTSYEKRLASSLLVAGFFNQIIGIIGLFTVHAQMRNMLEGTSVAQSRWRNMVGMSKNEENADEVQHINNMNIQRGDSSYAVQKMNSVNSGLGKLTLTAALLRIIGIVLPIFKYLLLSLFYLGKTGHFFRTGSLVGFIRAFLGGGIAGIIITVIASIISAIAFILQIIVLVRYSKIENKNKTGYICAIVGFFVRIVGVVGLFIILNDLKSRSDIKQKSINL